MNDQDTLRRFVFENAPVRGELIQLRATWQAVLERHTYPPVVRETLGELLAAAGLLSGTIKYDGSLIMQIRGNGPITTLVAECTSQRTLRGLAHWNGDVKPAPLSTLTGAGHVVITIDPGQAMERYQGIVALEGDSIAQVLGNYLEQSEQLDTRLWLAADEKGVAGLLLQKLPTSATGEADTDADIWNRVLHLAATVQPEELLNLDAQTLIRRLFNEEDVRMFESERVSFRCGCERARVATMLRALGADEVRDILNEQGVVSVACEFCNQKYTFDAVDVEQIFAGSGQPAVPGTRH